jgi:hypothetical protein
VVVERAYGNMESRNKEQLVEIMRLMWSASPEGEKREREELPL